MLLASACFSGGRPASALSAASPALTRPRPQLTQRRRHLIALQVRSNAADSRDGSSSSSELSPPTPQQAAAANRLLALSKSHRIKQQTSDEQLRQRTLRLLQLRFSEAAIEQHIGNRKGGPYAAWATVGELVALLRREGFNQQQLDCMLEGNSGTTSPGGMFTRAPADVAANLAWLRQQFGLEPAGLAKACSRAPALLGYKVETLQANWQAIVAAYHPTEAAMPGFARALRMGYAEFLYLPTATVGNKMDALQELLGLSEAKLRDKFGALAGLVNLDLHAADDGPAQRFDLLQELTGLPKGKLTGHILRLPTLLRYPIATLWRKHGAIVQALGGDAAAAKLLLSRYPDALIAEDDRVPRNLATLQRLGCSSPEAVKQVLLANGRLAALDLERPAFAARVAYWQQAYELESAEAAMLKYASLLHQRLCTLAPRVAFWRSCRAGQPLPNVRTFTSGDATFCKQQRLSAEQFLAFKQQWLASEEGRQVCRWERQHKAPTAEPLSFEQDE